MSARRHSEVTPPSAFLTSWPMTTPRATAPGASTTNGSSGRPRPSAAPPASTAAGRARRAVAAASSTAMPSGTSAQSLTAAANPNAAPPHASRPADGTRPAAEDGPPARPGHPVTVEDRRRGGQAAQVQPRLQQKRVRRRDRIRIHRVQPARDTRRHRAAVPDQDTKQHHVRRVRGHRQQPRRRQPPRGPGHLGQQGGGHHQQHPARRLHHREIPVRDYPRHQAQRVPEQHPVVILRHPEQVAGPGQLVQAQRQRRRRAPGDD